MASAFIEFTLTEPGKKRWGVYFDYENNAHVNGKISPRELAVVQWANDKLREIRDENQAGDE